MAGLGKGAEHDRELLFERYFVCAGTRHAPTGVIGVSDWECYFKLA